MVVQQHISHNPVQLSGIAIYIYIYIYIQLKSGFQDVPCGSTGKESACNVGDMDSISGLGRFPWRRKGYPLQYPGPSLLGFPDSSVGKEPTCNAGDAGLIPGSGRFPGEVIGYPLQYFGLENSMDCTTVHGIAQSRTQLSNFHFHFRASLMAQMVKNLPANAGDPGLITELGRSPREGNGNPFQYSCLRIPWTEEPGGLQFTGSHRVGHD